MRTPLLVLAALSCAVSTACTAAPQVVLKEPIADRCAAAELQGCSSVTDGVLLYVSGDKANGRDKLLGSAAQNASDHVRHFADGLLAVVAVPGATAYMTPVLEAANILRGAPAAPSAHTAAEIAAAKIPRPTVSADSDLSRLEGGQVVPGASPAKAACGPSYGAGASYCVPLAKGPFVLTDAAVNPACPNTLFLAAGSPDAPRWIAVNPNRSGSRLVVKAGETLTGGVLAQEEKEVVKDGRCAITWYGFWPYGAAEAAPASKH
jgi:hypothetical protein